MNVLNLLIDDVSPLDIFVSEGEQYAMPSHPMYQEQSWTSRVVHLAISTMRMIRGERRIIYSTSMERQTDIPTLLPES